MFTMGRIHRSNLKLEANVSTYTSPGFSSFTVRYGTRTFSTLSSGSSGEAVYSAAKAGIIGFSKTLARELARHQIQVNVVCPGPTDTPLIRGMAADLSDGEKFLGALRRAVPMGRLGTPEDVAPAVAFLASEAAGFITGQTLSVSGGLTMC